MNNVKKQEENLVEDALQLDGNVADASEF